MQTDPEARRILDRMVAAHRALVSFSCQLQVDAVSDKRRETTKATLAYQKPGRIWVEVKRTGKPPLLLVSDGTNRLGAGRQRVKAEGGDAALLATLIEANLLIAPAFLYLLSRSAPVASLLPGAVKLVSLGTPFVLDETPVVVVAADVAARAGAARLTFTVGRDDHLLRKLSVETTFEKENLSLMELYTQVRANPPLDKSLFTLPQ